MHKQIENLPYKTALNILQDPSILITLLSKRLKINFAILKMKKKIPINKHKFERHFFNTNNIYLYSCQTSMFCFSLIKKRFLSYLN